MNQLITENIFYKKGNQTILSNINLQFTQGINGILGQNGVGKSTFLKLLNGIITPTSGSIRLNETPITRIPRKVLSQWVSFVPQVPPITFNFTAEELVKMGLYSHKKMSKNEALFCIHKALLEVDALHLSKRFLFELSSGERQRIYLARALVSDSPILLLDEPTSNLDINHQLHIWKLLEELKPHKLILITLHDLHAAERFCDRLILFHHGMIKAEGTYSEISKTIHSSFEVMESLENTTTGFDIKID